MLQKFIKAEISYDMLQKFQHRKQTMVFALYTMNPEVLIKLRIYLVW